MIALSRLCALALAVVAAACTLARADDRYPSRVITIVVPLTPGTAIDIQARLYADGLAKRFGYQAVVVNRAGAGTLIGAETVANASPDGYTVLLTNSAHAILGAMNRNSAVRSNHRLRRHLHGRAGADRHRGPAVARRS